MISIIQNLRIGTKLAVTSGLTILLVAGMIYLQISGGAQVESASDNATRQQTIAYDAAEAKASVGGMQIGIRDVLLASTATDLDKAAQYFADRKAAALRFRADMAKLSRSKENGERITRLEVLIESLDKGKDQFVALRKQAIAMETKRGAGEAEATAQLAKLAEEAARIRRDVTLPINHELEAISKKITDYSKKASEEALGTAHDRKPRSSGRR